MLHVHVTQLGLGKVFSVSRKETIGSLSGVRNVPILDFGQELRGYDNESAESDAFSKVFKTYFVF